jgi:hypothetical protein
MMSTPEQRQKRNEYMRMYNMLHREEYRQSRRKYYQQNKDRCKQYKKAYYEANKEQLREANKQWIENNPDKNKAIKQRYYQRHPERVKACSLKSKRGHPDYMANYIRNRKANDINFKLSLNLRKRFNMAIKHNFKGGSAVRDLGCSIAEFKQYIESKFQQGMDWSNYGQKGWHLDHIIPLSSVDVGNREQVLPLLHYTNFQPLWAKDNISKRDKVLVA